MDNFPLSLAVLCVAMLMHATSAHAEESGLRPIDLDAKSMALDRKSNTTTFTTLRIKQGKVVIQAARATVRGFNSAQSDWQLSGKLSIQIDSAVIRAEQGSFAFSDNQLISGKLSGNPAVFEELKPEKEDKGPVRGTAQNIYYDNTAGTIRMEGGAAFTVGKNEMKGCDLIYDLKLERVTSGSSDCDKPFTITIVPPGKKAPAKERSSSP